MMKSSNIKQKRGYCKLHVCTIYMYMINASYLQVLTEKCSAMNDQLKVLQTELALIEKERESFQEK